MVIKNKYILIIITILNVVTISGVIIYKSFNYFINKEKKIKIMCIGDSITDDIPIKGSYRKFLYNGLIKKGFNIDMIGSKRVPEKTYKDKKTGESFKYDAEHTGYSGYTIKSTIEREGIYEKLKQTNCLSLKPDIIILLIGTNNIMDNLDHKENIADFETLLDYILENIPSTSILFVSTIPDMNPNRKRVYSWFDYYRITEDLNNVYNDEKVQNKVKELINRFNKDINSLVNERQKVGQNVRIVDLNSVINDINTQLKDGVHPNDVGFKEIGKYLTNIIGNYLNRKK